ncbi:hypothetical protein PMKS-003702 [Pichia membranifaciens]|uniref:Uncharacterized protein n=1 Tax=Pichia membranifaciens TaxID=4926 RepID=A0A1Q2YLF9_9ASCO|nr:hypothetical protein PMKS-003702 [Pichia membranifaciens]
MVSFLNSLSRKSVLRPTNEEPNGDRPNSPSGTSANPRSSLSLNRNSIRASVRALSPNASKPEIKETISNNDSNNNNNNNIGKRSSRFAPSSGATTASTTSIRSSITEHSNLTSAPSLSQTPLVKRAPVSAVNPSVNHSLSNNYHPVSPNNDVSSIQTKPAKIKDPSISREIENLRTSYRQQNFWKYHIVKLAPHEFYMTTNPDKRHRFIRNAPSYFVKLELPTDSNGGDKNGKNGEEKRKSTFASAFKNRSQVDKGFRLVFTQQQVIGINGYDGCYRPFVIEKVPKEFGGHYKISCQYNEFQQDWNLHNNVNENNIKTTRNLNFQFTNSNAKPSKNINNPYADADEAKKDKDKEKEKAANIYDASNNLVLADDYTMGDFLHVCVIKEKKKSLFIKSKFDGVKLAKPNSVYFLDTGFFKKRKWFDPIVSVFRPCNRDVKNKLTKSMLVNSKFNMNLSDSKKLFSANKLNVDFSNINLKDGRKNDNDDDDDDDDDDFDYDNDEDEDEEMSENVTDLDNPTGSNYDKFYNAKDGLYSRHPKDDSPNDYKLGWLTIYEKGRYFEKIPNGGNWQMVLGLTFATGFEKMIDKYIKDLTEVS